MKKLLKILAFVMCVLTLLSLTACGSFMSGATVNSVVKEFGTPQAEMTLTFTTKSNNKFKYVITYDLLLEKTPITVINFINLVESGFYNDAIFDSYNSTNNYFSVAKYAYRKNGDSSSLHGYENVSGITMAGEFKTNYYREPKGGYEQFSMFSLAMFHENKAESFDSANGALIFSTASSSSEDKKPLNYTNYAVFARMTTISVYSCKTVDSVETEVLLNTYTPSQMGSQYLQNLTDQTGTTSCSMTDASGDSKSVTVLGQSSVPRFIISVKMLGDKDWTKLPKVN